MFTVVINGSQSRNFDNEAKADKFISEFQKLMGNAVRIIKYSIEDLYDSKGNKKSSESIKVAEYGPKM